MATNLLRATARPIRVRLGLGLLVSFAMSCALAGISPPVLLAATPSSYTVESTAAPVHVPDIWDFIFGYEIHSPCDECTGVPEFGFAACCGQHDIAYGVGGTWQDRLQADRALRNCIWNSGEPFLALIYYLGVRLFGWLFYNFLPASPLKKRKAK